MGDSGSQQTQTSNSVNYPSWATAEMQKFATPLLDQALGKVDLSGGTHQATASNLIDQFASGAQNSPTSNPYFQQIIDSTMGTANKAFDTSMNKVSGAAKKAGWDITGKSLGESSGAAANLANSLGTTAGNLGSNLYEQGVQQQLSMIPAESALGNEGLSQALTLGNFLKGLEGNSTTVMQGTQSASPFSMMTGLFGSIF